MKSCLRRIGALCVVAAFAVVPIAAQADDIEGVWIDLFDGETLFGWHEIGDVDWNVTNGNLRCDTGAGGWAATSSQFSDFDLEATVRVLSGSQAALAVRAPLTGHPSENGAYTVVLEGPEGDGSAEWQEVRVSARGPEVTATVDGEPVELMGGGSAIGHIGVHYYERADEVEVQSMRLRPVQLRSIFNGEDLTGWNIIPDRDSEFFVEDGLLRVVDGNGQIETEELFKDFVLQIDCISHGDHLNSGVFFRGPPGVFWRGYEAQIRNQWVGDDRTQAVDYGTGGIYGNQPARKVTTDDYEWFTMTVVVRGNHMAVWLDEYLVADYTDMRPPIGNYDGKAGYVADAGTIHLQGHDPATDLSFRNIHIQEYPAH